MDRKRLLLAGVLILATGVASIVFAAGQLPSSQNNPAQQTGSVDIEVLTVPRSNGMFLSVQPANFTAAFSFSPTRPVILVTRALLSLSWDQLSLGHVGDQFSVQLNAHSPSLITMDHFASQVISMPSSDVQVGANSINIGVIPISAFATQSNTNYLLFEVRLTVQYTFLSA